MSRLAALAAAAVLLAVGAAPARASFGFPPAPAGFSVSATEANGDPATLAGSHPYALAAKVAFNLEGGPGSPFPEGDAKDLYLQLPPGLIENPGAVPQCSQADFYTPRSSPYEASDSGESCPDASQIGVVSIDSAGGERHFGVFNLVPPPGYPSRFGFSPFGAPISFTPHVRQANGEYGLTLASRNLSQLFDLREMELTIWGNPWATSHDGERGNCLNEAEPTVPHGQCAVVLNQQSHSPRAYLTLPSACTAPLAFSLSADSWAQPGAYLPSGEPDLSDAAWKHAESVSGSLQGCDELGFFSQASVLPSSEFVSSPTGLSVRLETNQAGLLGPLGRYSSQIKRAVIALPEGMTINPSVGAGLGDCMPAQYAAESATSAPGTGCPNPSKVGVVSIETPLVEGTLKGSLFIAKPFDNPFGAPYALYFVAKSPERGFLVKVAGKLDADARTGRLTATFDNLPQLPYSNLKVDFREGQRAPLVSPPACGTYTSQIGLSPWREPEASLQQISSFKLARGIAAGGACPTGGAAPFAPRAAAGTLNANAGSYTSFYLHLTRSDAEQEITSYSAQLPPGLLGKIAGIPFCGDAAIAAAKSRSGTAEMERPSCPAASRIGHTVSGYGVGLAPAYAPGEFYLAGPYHGSPLSVVAINSAIVGPFDLGTIVIRSAIQVDPRSARVTIDSAASDPIPHIFAGIPLRLRDVRVYMDRPGFMVNPTSCAPFSIASTLTGSDAPFTNPRDVVASATVPYQLSNCSSLKFETKVALSVKGGTKRGDYQELQVVVTPRSGDANIAAGAVTLPPSLFLAQNHIRTICTRPQSEADACSARSVIGRAAAQTPLLAEPLEGPVYLRSSSNALPDLVTVLHGPMGIRIVLEGRIDSYRGGIRGSFEALPDAPVTKFTMTILGGRKRGILVSSDNLCRSAQLATARLVGQNNLAAALRPRVGIRCRKGAAKRKHAKRKVQQR